MLVSPLSRFFFFVSALFVAEGTEKRQASLSFFHQPIPPRVGNHFCFRDKIPGYLYSTHLLSRKPLLHLACPSMAFEIFFHHKRFLCISSSSKDITAGTQHNRTPLLHLLKQSVSRYLSFFFWIFSTIIPQAYKVRRTGILNRYPIRHA